MINKRIVPAAWFEDEQAAHLIDVHSRGLDRFEMSKYASSDFVASLNIAPKKGRSFIHLISLGAGERYGPNTNADYFNKTARSHTAPAPVTPSVKTIQLAGGLDEYHKTFMKYGGVYKEHNNSKKGGKRYGDVYAEMMSPTMDRGELVIEVDNDSWGDNLHKMASGKNVFFSMGAGLPYDICSYCHNKAATRKQYCQHMTHQKLQLSKEGHQIYAFNDRPHFHDISDVVSPSDKIAFGLSKVASDGALFPDHFNAPELTYIPLALIDKLGSRTEHQKAAAVDKMSKMEKQILMQGMSPAESCMCDSFEDDLPSEDIKHMSEFPLGDVLGALKKSGVMLPPKAFIRIVIKKPEGDIKGLDGIHDALRTVFSDISKEGSTYDLVEDSSYDTAEPRYWTELHRLVDKVASSHSMSLDNISRRILYKAVTVPHLGKLAGDSLRTAKRISAESRYLAREYAKYQISFVAGADPSLAEHAAIHNQSSF